MPTLFRAIGATGGTPKSLQANSVNLNWYQTLALPLYTFYQVPAGKTFKITRVIFTGEATANLLIGYADNGVDGGGAAPTNPVWLIGSLKVAVANTTYGVDIYAEIPATKYPFARAIAAAIIGCQVLGVEETA